MTLTTSRIAPPTGTSPYKGLMPYAEDDAAYFFGRDTERQLITTNLRASRLTLLYGPSGVGKSSVLRAGAVHHLRERSRRNLAQRGRPEFAVVEYSTWRDDPIAGLSFAIALSVQAVMEGVGEGAPEPTAPLSETIAFWSGQLNGDLLIILDQFEEYFLYHGQEDGEGTFATEFPKAVADQSLRVSFLVSIREDALAKLDRFKARIPNLFENRLSIDHLDRKAARQAIEKPIARYNEDHPDEEPIAIEPDLVEAVLEQVKAGQVTIGQAGGGAVGMPDGGSRADERVETPYLQLVMSRIWDEEGRAGSRTLRRSTLDSLGGAERIVRTHLDEAMGEFTPEDRDVACDVFHYLVTPSGTKIAHSAPDLADYTDEPVAVITPVLERLCSGDVRILRAIAPPPGEGALTRYEIFHDVLAAAVLDWRARFEQARAQAAAERKLEEERRAAEERSRQERARARRLTSIAAGAVAFAVAVGALAIWAVSQRSAAQHQQRVARSQELAAKAISLLPTDPQAGLRTALDAVNVERTALAENALRQALPVNRVRLVLHGHTGQVFALAYSPDGKTLLSGSGDRTARLWDAATGQTLHILKGHENELADAAFDPTGNMVATTGGNDHTTRIWDAKTGAQLQVLRGSTDSFIGHVSFSPDGRFVLTSDGGADTATIWDTSTGAAAHILTGHTDYVSTARFSPDGSQVITASSDGTVVTWSTDTGAKLKTFDYFANRANDAMFSPNGRYVAIAESDGYTTLWKARSAIRKSYLCCESHQVDSLAFSPDSKFLVAASSLDQVARLFETTSTFGRGIAVFPGHATGVSSDGVSFSADGSLVATAGGDGVARVWEARAGQELFALRGHTSTVFEALFNPSGTTLTTASGDGTVREWDVDTGLALRRDTDQVRTAVFSKDGSHILTASIDASARLYDAKSGELIHTLSHDQSVDGAVFSPDESVIATATEDGYVHFWKADDGTETTTCCYHDGWHVWDVGYSPDGTKLLVTYADRSVRVWDLAASTDTSGTSEIAATESSFVKTEAVRGAWSPDGKTIVTLGRDRIARLWDAASGKERHALRGHTGFLVDVAFSGDSKRLVTSSIDRTAKIWDASSGKLLRTLEGSTSAVTAVTFNPKGTWVVAGTADGETFVWGANTGRVLSVLRSQAGYINGVAISPDGKRILTASDDLTAKAYGCDTCVSLDQLIKIAERVLRIAATPGKPVDA